VAHRNRRPRCEVTAWVAWGRRIESLKAADDVDDVGGVEMTVAADGAAAM
jgi:hypothetical protein